MKVKNILAFRNDRFGEFLLNIPAFRALKESYPGAQLVLAVDPYLKELAGCIDFQDGLLEWENRKHNFLELLKFAGQIRKRRFDLCLMLNPSREFNIISFLAGIPVRVGYDRKWGFLLTHKIKDRKYMGEKHEVEYNLDLAKLAWATTQNKSIPLKVDRAIINKLCADSKIDDSDKPVVMHPWASDPRKEWPAQYFAELAQRIARELNKKVLLIGRAAESAKSKEYFKGLGQDIIDLSGKTSLVELAALLERCAVLISADSGPMHLACAVGTPVIALFRNDLPGKTARRWGPWQEKSRVIERNDLAQISVSEVFDQVREVL